MHFNDPNQRTVIQKKEIPTYGIESQLLHCSCAPLPWGIDLDNCNWVMIIKMRWRLLYVLLRTSGLSTDIIISTDGSCDAIMLYSSSNLCPITCSQNHIGPTSWNREKNRSLSSITCMLLLWSGTRHPPRVSNMWDCGWCAGGKFYLLFHKDLKCFLLEL